MDLINKAKHNLLYLDFKFKLGILDCKFLLSCKWYQKFMLNPNFGCDSDPKLTVEMKNIYIYIF